MLCRAGLVRGVIQPSVSRTKRRDASIADTVPPRMALQAKRAADISCAALLLIVSLPLLLWTALVAFAVQGLPILYRAERAGLGGQPFTMWKFRTMRPSRPSEVWYRSDSTRVTPLGRFLRSTSIDELPQLWNVLRGDMSLVGPRPLLMEYLDVYSPEERRRCDMRPGLTSWAIVHGRHTSRFEERLRLDTWYVDHWSLRLDARIIALTACQLVRRSDASVTQDLAEIDFPLRFSAALDRRMSEPHCGPAAVEHRGRSRDQGSPGVCERGDASQACRQ